MFNKKSLHLPDDHGDRRTFGYDSLGRLISVKQSFDERPDVTLWTGTYNSIGQLSQTNTGVSSEGLRINIILILVSSLLFLCSCDLKSRNTELTNIDNEPFKCYMDSSINEFQLMDSESFDSVFSYQVDNYMVNNCQLGEGIYVSNSLYNEFLFMKFNNGGIGHEFDTFFVSDSIPAEFYSYLMHSNIPRFVSTNGAHIGMSKEDFLNLYSSKNNIRLDSLYIQYDTIDMLYNHFLFKNDTLKSILIGYDW